jgi:acyl carrier protein phosphodiesterase
MNYLVHLYLAPQQPLVRLGSFAGDFVKGAIGPQWPADFARGLRLHRRLDAFAHDDPAFNRSRQRLTPDLGLYRGVLVDIYYDHFLARHWRHFAPDSLVAYAAAVYADLERNLNWLPAGLQRIAPRIVEHDWLVSYGDSEVVELVLRRMAHRGRHSGLAAGLGELERHYRGLEEDFFAFMAGGEGWLAGEMESSEG